MCLVEDQLSKESWVSFSADLPFDHQYRSLLEGGFRGGKKGGISPER